MATTQSREMCVNSRTAEAEDGGREPESLGEPEFILKVWGVGSLERFESGVIHCGS